MGQVRKIKAGLVKIPIDQFVGEDGHIFFDTDDGTLRLSDGVTPGGSILSGGGGGAGGIALTNLSVSAANASGSGSLLYNNTTGVFTYTPPDLSGYSTFSGSYSDLTNKPTLFSGSYSDLTNKPTLFSGDYTDLTSKPTLFSGDYTDLTSKPTLFSGDYTDLTNKPTLFDGVYDSLTSKPTLFSGDYDDLTNKPTIPTDYGDHSTQGYLTSYTETDPVVGAITGIVKADGAGSISAAVAGTDYSTLALGTTSTTALAGDTALSAIGGSLDLSSQVTGILPVSNMAATALTTVQTAADETAQLALTTEEGDVVVRTDENKTYMRNGGTADPHDMTNFTLLATPTDAVTSVDGNTGAVTTLQIGTTATTALAGNTPYITLGDLSIGAPNATENGGIAYNNSTGTFTYYRQTHLVNSAATDDIEIGSTNQAGEINIGMSTLAHTISIGKGQTGSGNTRTINVGTTGTTGSVQNINLGYVNSSYVQKFIKIGNASQAVGTNSQIDMYGEILMEPGDKNNAFTIGGQNQIGTITLGRSADDQTINIATNPSTSGKTKTINIGTGNTTGSTTAINIGPSSTATTTNTNIYGNAMHKGGLFEFRTTAATSGTVDQVVKFAAQDAYGNYPEAGEIVVYGVTNAPSRMVIGYSDAGMTFFSGFGAKYIQPASTTTGLASDNDVDFGSYNARWKIGRFASGTTTLSDRNEKRDIEELNEAELRVATTCKGLLRKYRMIEAYETKGDDARIHFGIIAQDLEDAFTAEGLDAHRYAMFMEDTWYDIGDGVAYPSLDDISEEDRENAVEKTKLGVRYEQVLAFIIAAI